jgi:hypothetical protein
MHSETGSVTRPHDVVTAMSPSTPIRRAADYMIAIPTRLMGSKNALLGRREIYVQATDVQ